MEISVTLTLPDAIAAQLQLQQKNISLQLLESFAAEKYRDRLLTAYQVGQLLGHDSWWETEEFLQQHQCFHHYDDQELEEEMNLPGELFKEEKYAVV